MRSVRSIALSLVVLSGCTAPVSEAPATSPTPPTPEATPAKQPTPPTDASGRGLVGPPPTEAMVQQMIAQLVLDHPRVTPFLHLEIPANAPLAVFAAPDLAAGAASLRAGGQPVRVVATASDARLVLRGRESLGPAKERLTFEIPAEGVSGTVDVALADHVWRAVDASVSER